MCAFDDIQRGSEVEVRLGKLKNGKALGKDDVTRDMVNGGSDIVVNWIWGLCNMPLKVV